MLEPVYNAARGDSLKPTLILLVSSPLLLSWRYYGTPEFYRQYLAPILSLPGDPGAAGAVYSFISAFLLLGVLPAVMVRFVFRERLRDYGVSLGVRVRTVRTLLLLAPVFLLAGWLGAGNAALAEHFPINPRAGETPAAFALHAATYFLYYVGWEFYFRGFLLFGLRDAVGDANAVLIQTLASVLLHIGSPAPEAFGAIFGGLLWGMLALRTRSLLSGLGQHFLLGISLDYFLCY